MLVYEKCLTSFSQTFILKVFDKAEYSIIIISEGIGISCFKVNFGITFITIWLI